MALLRNKALSTNPVLTRFPASDLDWYQFVRELDKQSVEATAISGSIEAVSSLPTLPDTNYPVGSVVFLTSDGKLYRNVSDSWSKAVDGGDITAASILANSIGAGQVTAAKIDVSELSAISADLGNITAGNIVLSEFIRAGQTAYNTGTGFWLGVDSGTPKLSIGSPTGPRFTFDGSELQLVPTVKSFTPTWGGFSSAPTGDCNYITFGSFAMLWPADDGSFFGTSNSNIMSMGGLPAEIRPSIEDIVAPVIVFDSDTITGTMGQAHITDLGLIGFDILVGVDIIGGSSNKLVYDSSSFAGSSFKGWNGVLIYPII